MSSSEQGDERLLSLRVRILLALVRGIASGLVRSAATWLMEHFAGL